MLEIKKNNRLIVVLIDEGTGTYEETFNSRRTVSSVFRSIITGLIGIGSPMLFRAIGDSTLVNYAIVDNVKEYGSLSKSRNQKVLQRGSIRTFLNNDNTGEYFNFTSSISNVDYIYLGAQYNKSDNMLDLEGTYIRRLFESISNNQRILIKPHPRGIPNKYLDICKEFNNVEIIKYLVAVLPIEYIINLLGCKNIICYESSAIQNVANTFPHIRCILTINVENCIGLPIARQR